RIRPGSVRVGKDKDGVPGRGYHGHCPGKASPAAAPAGRCPVVDGGSLCVGFCGTVLLFLLEKIGCAHQAARGESPGGTQDRRKGTGRERCCNSLTRKNNGCWIWRERP